ncbi:MAG TPA: SMP-30/gluconolactonase/LRE family protein, partial [Terriglobales bacterium]|nr:SMP-30/gluconolactonase/LRE family protein [Terriglobales bacterium]
SFYTKLASWIGLGLIALAAGCAAQKPVEEARPAWPPPPDKARIEFVRTVSSEDDVVHDTTFTQKVADFLAGTKPTPAQIVEPNGIAVSDDGSVLYVSDRAQGAVFVFDFGKKQFLKVGAEKEKGEAGLDWPMGVALDGEQNIYVVEQGKKAITVFDPSGKQLRSFTDPSLERPTGIAIDRERKRVYVADSAHTLSKQQTVKIFSLDGKLIGKIGGQKGDGPGYFNVPTYVWVDNDGDVYVTDTMNCRVQAFSPDGKYIRSYGERGDAYGQFSRPKGVALDSFHNVYVVDSAWSNVQIFNPQGQVLLFFGGRGPLPGMLKNATAVAIDKNNRIYVGDYLNHRVEEYQLVNTTAADSVPDSGAPPAAPATDSPKS